MHAGEITISYLETGCLCVQSVRVFDCVLVSFGMRIDFYMSGFVVCVYGPICVCACVLVRLCV